MNTLPPALQASDCRTEIATKVFRLRPPDYGTKHPIWPGMVGIEVEMMPFVGTSLEAGQTPRLTPLRGANSLSEYLAELSATYEDWVDHRSSDGSLMSVSVGADEQFTFEPGGQLEFSTKPYPCLVDADTQLKKIQKILDEHFYQRDVKILQGGTHPWASAETIGLQMTKARYQAMNEHFRRIGPFGQRMMRETSTVQVNLDFGESEDILAKRYLAANLMSASLTAIFANSPVTEGRLNGLKSQRSAIWYNLDNSRTGYPELKSIARSLTLESCVDAYYDHVMAAQVIFVEELGFKVPDQPTSFLEWIETGIEGTYPRAADFQTHLTLHFPEVRPKGFLELRSIDCQAQPWQTVPACVSTALLYDDKNLNAVIALLEPEIDDLGELWREAFRGLDSPRLAGYAKSLMELAISGFRRLPSCYQGKSTGKVLENFAETFTFQGQCPADHLIDAVKVTPDKILTVPMFEDVQRKWAEAANRSK